MSLFSRLLNILFPHPISEKDFNRIPKAPPPPESYMYSLYDYHHPHGKKLVYAIKKFSDPFVDEYISEAMYLHLLSDMSEQQDFGYFRNPFIIPVPISRKRHHERGFNQVASIAQRLAQKLGGTHIPHLVIKIKENKKQALVKNKRERFQNVRGCFAVHPKQQDTLRNQDIILVDDLITTGATLGELKKLCEHHGARRVIAITIAH